RPSQVIVEGAQLARGNEGGRLMGGVFGLRQRPAALASASLVSLTALGVGVLAFMDPGVPSADVELHDGAVWLTNQSTLMVGHLNHPSQVLDGAVRTTTSQFD